MLDIQAELEELSSLLTRAAEVVDGISTKFPQDTVGWLEMAKDALVQDSMAERAGISEPADNVSQLYSCDICEAGPFKNELGLQIHQGRSHKKETRARKRTVAVS